MKEIKGCFTCDLSPRRIEEIFVYFVLCFVSINKLQTSTTLLIGYSLFLHYISAMNK